jgi:hypothetical protein
MGATSAGGASNGGSSTPIGGSGAVAGAAPTTGGVGGPDTTGGMAGMAAAPSITSCTNEFPFLGEWQGNVLDFYFEPIEELHLSVRVNDGGDGYVGTFTWGTGDPPAPATDGNAPYPEGTDVFDGGGGSAGGPTGQLWPGYPYTVVRGAGCDRVFRVSVSGAQLYDTWCALQEPIDNGPFGWGCIVQTGSASGDAMGCHITDDDGNVVADYPMWRCELCGLFVGTSVCSCSASGCSYNPEPTHSYELTLSQSDGVDVLSGMGPAANCGDCTIRLERVE